MMVIKKDAEGAYLLGWKHFSAQTQKINVEAQELHVKKYALLKTDPGLPRFVTRPDSMCVRLCAA